MAKNTPLAKQQTPTGETAKDKALSTVLAQLEKDFGKGTIMTLGDEGIPAIEAIPTGSIALDAALGIGGIPKGRICEIYGPESSGKTTMCYHLIAQCQKQGGRAAFIDAEHAMDLEYAKNLGVDPDALLISQPDYGEQALEIAIRLTNSGAVDLIVIDSVAALTPRAELEGQMGDATVGLQARMMGSAMRKIAGAANRTKCTIFFTNQIREKVGVSFGSPETQPGGRALKFYASVRMDIRPTMGGQLKDKEEVVGRKVKVKMVKNKVAPPFRIAEMDIVFGEGISHEGEILDLGLEHKLLTKSGAFWSYGEQRLGQGREAARTFLKENVEIADEIEQLIRNAMGIGETLEIIPDDTTVAPELGEMPLDDDAPILLDD